MTEQDPHIQLATAFAEHRARLKACAIFHLPTALEKLYTADDVLQEASMAALARQHFFQTHPEIPVFVKFRKILLQTLLDLQRRHLAAQKRGLGREVAVDDLPHVDEYTDPWNRFANTSQSSPRSHLLREERYETLREAIGHLSPQDQLIIQLRDFEALTNQECAAELGIPPKNASLRYIRAIQRLKNLLQENSTFRN